jgi:hypothetical protein
MSSNTLLEDLLLKNSSRDLARRCLNALSKQTSADYKSTRPVPLNEIRDIYSRRARLNKKRNGPVEGFDELIPALNVESEDSIVVHGFETDQEAFTIFTNASMTRLIGVLISQIKKN